MKTIASSFADLADVAAYKAAKKKGMTDAQAFAQGDNGVGCFGDITAQEVRPMCALPPEDICARFGSVKRGKHAPVNVKVGTTRVRCLLADVMPSKAHIKNGCGIDLNPAALKALKLTPPIKIAAEWEWA